MTRALCQSRARAPAGPLTAPRGKGSSSPSAVFTSEGTRSPSLPCHAPRCTGPARSLLCHPALQPLASHRSHWGCGYPSTVPAPMGPWQYHRAMLLSVSPPSPKSCCGGGWGWLVLSWATGTLCPSGARCVCWCTKHPRLLWDMCHPLPHSPASPAAITVLWTVLTQEGCLDVQPLPFGRALPLCPPSQDTGPQHTGLSLLHPFCPHSPLPSCPRFPQGHRMVGGPSWPGSGRATSCPLLLLDCAVHVEQDRSTVPPAQPIEWG